MRGLYPGAPLGSSRRVISRPETWLDLKHEAYPGGASASALDLGESMEIHSKKSRPIDGAEPMARRILEKASRQSTGDHIPLWGHVVPTSGPTHFCPFRALGDLARPNILEIVGCIRLKGLAFGQAAILAMPSHVMIYAVDCGVGKQRARLAVKRPDWASGTPGSLTVASEIIFSASALSQHVDCQNYNRGSQLTLDEPSIRPRAKRSRMTRKSRAPTVAISLITHRRI